MNIVAGKGFGKLADTVNGMIDRNIGLNKALSGSEFRIGYSHEDQFGVPAHALDEAVYCGDSALIGNAEASATVQAIMKQHPERISVRPKWNAGTNKYDVEFRVAGDAAPDLLAGQLFSPWNVTYLSKVWKEPLTYSNAKKLIRVEHGGANPWAEIFTLFLEQYAGWGVVGPTGNLQNSTTNDVNVNNGMASFPIINMMGTYTITLEEQRRNTWGPVGSSPIARKQSYLNYVMDMMDAILMLFGNAETGTPGLLDLTPIKAWDTGRSLKDIAQSTTITTRGSDAYRMLADRINDFLTRSDNKYNHLVVGLSPEAYNLLQSLPYSDVYSPEAAMKTFAQNYCAGKGPNGETPKIEFIPEPFFKASTAANPNPYNPNDFDLMSITAPEIGGGPDNETQATNFYATVLDKFVFPVIPGQYNHQYKTLRRVAGMVMPIKDAVEVYAGFGTQGA